jgi:hypothetical protein
MNKPEELLEMWRKDSVIDRTEPGKELINIPQLHSKYLNILSRHRLLAKEAEFKYNKMKKIKWEYFTGKLDDEQLKHYGWEPFQFVLKSDIQTYLEADKDLIKLLEKKVYHEETVSVIESIMNEIKQRTWQLKEFINWEKFVSGS